MNNSVRKSFLVTAAVIAVAFAQLAHGGDAPRRILVYGDSNTFGWHTNSQGKVDRYPLAAAWPGQMGQILGEGYELIVEGLGGRTTNLDGPEQTGSGNISGVGMNGAGYLPAALSSHMPLDLVIIMLGTNDLRYEFDRSAEEIAHGVIELACLVLQGEWQSKTGFQNPGVLVVSPPKVDCKTGPTAALFAGSLPKTEALAGLLRPLAECAGAQFLDAAAVVPFAEDADGVHLTPENHAALGKAAAAAVLDIFSQNP